MCFCPKVSSLFFRPRGLRQAGGVCQGVPVAAEVAPRVCGVGACVPNDRWRNRMGRRITREQLKKYDEFVSAAEMIFRWVAENWRPLVAGIGAVCVVGLLWWAVKGK